MKRKFFIFSILFLTIYFAAISGFMRIQEELADIYKTEGYKVFYSRAVANGETEIEILKDGTTISFETDLGPIEDEYVLEYDVTNSSKTYNIELDMICTEGNEYLEIKNQFNTNSLLNASETRSGKLVIGLKKDIAVEEDITVPIKCSIVETAKQKSR